MKCLTVSLAIPQEHIFDSTALIRCKYPFKRAIPVHSWARMLALLRLSPSYRFLVCLPGRAASISLENLPIPSGSFLSCFCLFNAVLSIVDLAAYIISFWVNPGWAACCAAVFAFRRRSTSASAGIHTPVIILPLFSSVWAASYIYLILACPDCCCSRWIACSADRLHVVIMICFLCIFVGIQRMAIAIAASSAVYGFCFSLLPRAPLSGVPELGCYK